jgi:thymidylate synthase (FAD)
MRSVEPEVFLVARPKVDYEAMAAYLREVGGERWLERLDRDQLGNDAQDLAEFAGKICYRSWEPGLNPNVRKTRDDQDAYLQNILRQQHGSVLEHVSFSFVLHNVSRVFTHELARHRPGTAISQESLRYVRLDELPFWFPDWAREDAELMKRATALLAELEEFQQWMAGHFGLDDDATKMHEKKLKTSFMRRFAPEGVATGLVWTANIRTLRHTIEARTDQGAEEEIRLVFGKIGEIMLTEAPALFGDYTVTDGTWVPGWRKVLPEVRARLVYLAAQVVVDQVARGAEFVEHPRRPADHRIRPAHVDVPVGPGRLRGQFRHGAVHDVFRHGAVHDLPGRLVRHRRDDL